MKKYFYTILLTVISLLLLPVLMWFIYHLMIFLNDLFLKYIDLIDLFFNNIPVSQGVAFISFFLSIGGLFIFISEFFSSDQ